MITRTTFINILTTVTCVLTYNSCLGMSSSPQTHFRFRCMKKPGAQAIIVAPHQAIQQSMTPTACQAIRINKLKIAPEAKVLEYERSLCTLATTGRNGKSHTSQEIATLEKKLLSCGANDSWQQTGLMLLMAQAQQLQEQKETQASLRLTQQPSATKDISAESKSTSQETATAPTEAELRLLYENFLKSPRRNHDNRLIQTAEQKVNEGLDRTSEYGVVDHIINEEEISDTTVNQLIEEHLAFLNEHKQ